MVVPVAMPKGINKGQQEEAITMNNTKIWYAVMMDAYDDDWGKGSFDMDVAIEMVRSNLDLYPDGYIAVINDETGVCIDEIRDI